MPIETLSLSKSSLAYAKLAATPTDSAWSQVYNAGNLFACLSLTTEPKKETTSLQNLGKELFNNLEAEFFTLEEKNLATIAEAINKSIKHIPEDVAVNFCLSFFKGNTLYLFLKGKGRVIMKRGEKLGSLLENKAANEDKQLLTASGFLQNNDTVIIETSQFAKNVSDQHISEALQLELPNDIAEALSLHMHENADGDQAAIIIVYHGLSKSILESTHEDLLEDEEEEQKFENVMPVQKEEKHSPSPFLKIKQSLAHIRLPSFSNNRHINMRLNHRKKIFLSITLIIFVLLIVSIVLTKQKQEQNKIDTLFKAVYTPAFENYDAGKSLQSLNPGQSNDDFLKAEKLLKDNQDKFPKDSKEAKQITDLLAKVESELGPTQDLANSTPFKEANASEHSLLAIEKVNTDGQGFSQDDNNIYFLTTKAAVAVTKSNGNKKDLIKNNSDWQQGVSIVPYQGNLYLLDQKDGILKYVGADGSYSKNAYFKSSSPDLSKAVSMAIDSSIWILFTDGTIKKFTRGEADSFSVKNLTKPFKNPTKIYTDKDINNVYILDNGNSRIVKLGNDGSFQSEYSASILQKAKDFEVLEKDKKILILSNDKIWELPI